MSAVEFPTAAERDAVLDEWSRRVKEGIADSPGQHVAALLAALAPFVAAREAQAHAEGERAAIVERDALREERDDWKSRRDRAVEECRLLHQEGMSRRDHHLKHCGAARAAEKAERERDEALAKVAAAEELAQEWKANDYRGWISSCGDDLLDTLRGAR